MIETKLFFMTEISDFPPCNHSMLIVSHHSFINGSLVLYLLWTSTVTHAPLSGCQLYVFLLLPTFCFQILLQFSATNSSRVQFHVSSWAMADGHFSPLWRSCVNICYLSVHPDASEVVPNVFFFLIVVHPSASDAVKSG